MTSLPSEASAISLGARESGTTRRQGTCLNLECNSGQTVPLILETGLQSSQGMVPKRLIMVAHQRNVCLRLYPLLVLPCSPIIRSMFTVHLLLLTIATGLETRKGLAKTESQQVACGPTSAGDVFRDQLLRWL